jgi:hypothetical protein
MFSGRAHSVSGDSRKKTFRQITALDEQCFGVTPGATPSFTASNGPGQCTQTQVQQTFVSYKVTTTFTLPVALPALASPTLSASGEIQIQ